MGGTGRRTIGHEVITTEYMSTVINQVEIPRHQEVGKLVSIVQVVFRDGYIPEALIWTTMVLVPKGGGGYIGIGLVEEGLHVNREQSTTE